MTHQNLILTEKAIKNHSKRLQKELKTLNQDLSLGEVQNLLSKTLGFNNFHELKKVLENEQKSKHPFDEIEDSFYNVLDKNQYFKVFIAPVNKINKKLQKELVNLINSLNLGHKEQSIKILKIEINEDSCVIFLDPTSKFSELNYRDIKGERIIGSTIAGACHMLISKICDYLVIQGYKEYYDISYGYKIKNDTRNFIHFEDLILKREIT